MNDLGKVYTPMMAILGLLFIVLSMFSDIQKPGTQAMLISGAILGAAACISGAIRHSADQNDKA